jgi:hypothetical protein
MSQTHGRIVPRVWDKLLSIYAAVLPFTCFCDTLKDVEQNTMETQNITLSLPKEILLRAKLLAVQRQTSVSGLLTQALTQIVEQEEQYAYARRRHLQLLDRAHDLGTGGALKTIRDELHERS